MISPKGSVTAFGSVPRMRSYTVGGTFEVGMYEYDSAFIFMPMADAQKFFNMDENVTNLEVFLDRHDLVSSVQRQISSQRLSF